MTIFGYHIKHSWQPIMQKEIYRFMGVVTQKEYPSRYRVCDECNTVQESNWSSQGEFWSKLSENEIEIIKDKIYKENSKWYFRGIIDMVDFRPPTQRVKK